MLDGLGGALSLRSFRALRPGGRLIVYGHSSTISDGHRSWRGWIEWYSATGFVALWGLLSAAPAGVRVPDPEATRRPPSASRRESATASCRWRSPRPGMVPGGLPRPARSSPSWRDPPRRRRANATLGCATRARDARRLGGEGKACACSISRSLATDRLRSAAILSRHLRGPENLAKTLGSRLHHAAMNVGGLISQGVG